MSKHRCYDWTVLAFRVVVTFAFLGCFAPACTAASIEEVLAENKALTDLVSHSVTPAEFERAIALCRRRNIRIGESLWIEIVNNHSYPEWHRRRCAEQLLSDEARQIKPAEFLDAPDVKLYWINPENGHATQKGQLTSVLQNGQKEYDYYELLTGGGYRDVSFVVVRLFRRTRWGRATDESIVQRDFARAIVRMHKEDKIFVVAAGVRVR